MTATMQPESKPLSRRALLAGALGGIGAWAASIIGRASPVRAGVDGDVVLGGPNTATSTTSITNHSNNSTALGAESLSGVGLGGTSTSYIGVYGSSTSYTGVYGNSYFQMGVEGNSYATDKPAIRGTSQGNSTAVQGYSGDFPVPAAKPKTGVFGYAAQDKYSRGVTGESPAGIGLYGISSSGYGVYSAGRVYTTQFYELTEIATPPAPIANRARLFVKDNGSGKTQLCVRFHTGAIRVIATEP